MPLTVRELNVKMVVDNQSDSKASPKPKQSVISEEKLIKKCVEAVIQILEDKNER